MNFRPVDLIKSYFHLFANHPASPSCITIAIFLSFFLFFRDWMSVNQLVKAFNWCWNGNPGWWNGILVSTCHSAVAFWVSLSIFRSLWYSHQILTLVFVCQSSISDFWHLFITNAVHVLLLDRCTRPAEKRGTAHADLLVGAQVLADQCKQSAGDSIWVSHRAIFLRIRLLSDCISSIQLD